MRHPPSRGSPGRAAGAGGPEVRAATRWASTVATTATAALGVVLALFAASGPRVAVRHEELVAGPRFASTDAPVTSAAERRSPARWSVPSHPALRTQSRRAGAAADDSPVEALARRNPRRPAGPEIIAVSSPAARFGDKLTLRGHRLGGATRVLFISHITAPTAVPS